MTGLAGDTQVTLYWNPIELAEYYEIFQGTSSGEYAGTSTATVTGDTYTYKITGLMNGTTYYFAIRAGNDGGTGPLSHEISVIPQMTAALAPTIESVQAGDGQITLGWHAVDGASYFDIFYGLSTGLYDDDPSATVTGDTYQYTLEGLTNGVTYYLALQARNAGGTSPLSNEVAAIPLPEPPEVPTGLTANPGHRQVSLKWNRVENADQYEIYLGTLADHFDEVPVATVNADTDEYIAMDLVNGTTYYFAIKALNAGGSSAMSEAIASTPTNSIPDVPEAPTGLFAEADDRKILLKWSGVEGAQYYDVYLGYASGQYIEQPVAIVSDVHSQFVVTGLQNGVTYYFAVKARNSSGSSHFSSEVNAKPRGNDFKIPTSTEPASSQSSHWYTVQSKEEHNANIVDVTVDTKRLEQFLQQKQENLKLNIPVTMEADAVFTKLSGESIDLLSQRGDLINIESDVGHYTIQASEIDHFMKTIDPEIPREAIEVSITLEKSTPEVKEQVELLAEKEQFELVSEPIDFSIHVSVEGAVLYSNQFQAYVERKIPIPEGIQPTAVTTAVIVEGDSIFHVPTYVIKRDNSYYAVINSLTNSTYTLIYNQREFKDVRNHWAKAPIINLTSRLIFEIEGDIFEPNKAITRAEFTTAIVRALGLTDGEFKAPFVDVNRHDKYANAISKAFEYDIVYGYEDHTFRPDQTITRQEAMLMISRAMELAGIEAALSEIQQYNILSKFQDHTEISIWAQRATAEVVAANLVVGYNGLFHPYHDITKAETAIIIEKLLQQAELIQSEI